MGRQLIKAVLLVPRSLTMCHSVSSLSNRCIARKRIERSFHSSTLTFQTMKDVRLQLDKWMEVPEGYVVKPPDRTHLLKNLVESQEELPARSIKDSFSIAYIPLSSQPRLQNRYATVNGKLRMGRIMEDMDFFAVFIALKHIKNPKWVAGQPTPYVIVTASVDDIGFISEKPNVTNDVRLSGKVVHAGSTSMNILVKLERQVGSNWEKMTEAHFVMVARNSTLTGPAIVNRIKPDGPEEEEEHKAALARIEKKKAAAKISLLHSPPSPEEQKIIHDIFMKSVDENDIGLNRRILPQGCIWMEESILTACNFPHPENRNHHNTVFGGYLMRMALELAWMTAYKYSRQKPSLRYISSITFKKSVSINSFLQIKSQVNFTKDNFMQIITFIELLDIVTREVETSNSFHFTYEVKDPVMPVVPRTYHEAILYSVGLREFKKARV